MTLNAGDFGKIAVLMGGWAAERDISLVSGAAVLKSLQASGLDAHGVDVGRDILTVLDDGKFDRAFIVLHGRGGEDGVIQGALEILGLPYTGSDVLGSALGMDKYRCKLLWQGAGLPTPGYALAEREADLEMAKELGFPLIVKPVREGSSLGIARADNQRQLLAAWRAAREYDCQVLIEQWIEGDEYTVAVVGSDALPVIKLETPNAFYDYAAKYQATDTQYLIPCGLDNDKEMSLQRLALQAFAITGGSNWGRVDFMMDADANPWLIEVNTVPGMTDHSLVPMAAKAVGMDFEDLTLKILAQTLGEQQ